MSVYIHEVKKILRPVPLLASLVFVAVYSFMFLGIPIDYLTNVHQSCDHVSVCEDLIGLCGPTIESEGELEGAVKTLSERYVGELEEGIRKEPLFWEAGIRDFTGLQALARKIYYGEMREVLQEGEEFQLYDYAPFDWGEDYTLSRVEREVDEKGLVFGGRNGASTLIKYSILNSYMQASYGPFGNGQVTYENLGRMGEDFKGPLYKELPEAARVRLRAIFDNGEMMNVLPGRFMPYIKMTYSYLVVMVFLSLCILIAPIAAKDNKCGIVALQHASKTGRRALGIQLAAASSVGLVVAVLEVGTFWLVFLAKGWSAFLGSGLNTFNNTDSISWFAGNYGQYILIVSIMMVVAALAATLAIFTVSKLCGNYISLILSVVPMVVVLVALFFQVFRGPFDMVGDVASSRYERIPIPLLDVFAVHPRAVPSLYQRIPIPYVEAYACAALLLVGVAMVGALLGKQKRTEGYG